MNLTPLARRSFRASALAAVAGLLAIPAAANVNIPEGGAVPSDSVSVIHVRVLDGCAGEATDRIEVEMPDPVRNVVPAYVPGWTAEVEAAGDDDQQVSVVRWTGGPLPAGQYLDFGLRAAFPEGPATLAFPVLQGCGLTEVRWDGERDSDTPAPLVSVGNHVGQRELGELRDTVVALSELLEGVDPADLESRLVAVEDRIAERLPEIVERMNRLADRIMALEEADAGGGTDG